MSRSSPLTRASDGKVGGTLISYFIMPAQLTEWLQEQAGQNSITCHPSPVKSCRSPDRQWKPPRVFINIPSPHQAIPGKCHLRSSRLDSSLGRRCRHSRWLQWIRIRDNLISYKGIQNCLQIINFTTFNARHALIAKWEL